MGIMKLREFAPGVLCVWTILLFSACTSSPVEEPIQEVTLAAETDLFLNDLPKSQAFTFHPKGDTLFTGVHGTQLLLPKGCFLLPDGNPPEGDVKVELNEALALNHMVLANLTTTSNGSPLTTDGMFFLNARTLEGAQLKIDPRNPPYLRIPTDQKLAGIKLYQGIRDPEGNINWVDPAPLEDHLIPIPFDQLSFYPPGFVEAVEAALPYRGQTEVTRTLLDSLYYGLSAANPDSLLQVFGTDDLIYFNPTSQQIAELLFLGEVLSEDEQSPPDLKWQAEPASPSCGITPEEVGALQTPTYAGSFIATPEFNERLKAIYRSGDASLLDIYLIGMDKALWENDQLAADQLGDDPMAEVFREFAREKKGRIRDGKRYADILKVQEGIAPRSGQQDENWEAQEWYETTIPQLGWWNIDLPALPDQPGMITLQENEVRITINGQTQFDRTHTYLIVPYPRSVYYLNTRQAGAWSNGTLSIPLASDQEFPVVVIAWKGADRYWAKGKVGNGNFATTLAPELSSPEEIEGFLAEEEALGKDQYFRKKILDHEENILRDQIRVARREQAELLWTLYYVAHPGCDKPGKGRSLFLTGCRACHSQYADLEVMGGIKSPSLGGVGQQRGRDWLMKWTWVNEDRLEDDAYMAWRDSIAQAIHPGDSSFYCASSYMTDKADVSAILDFILSTPSTPRP